MFVTLLLALLFLAAFAALFSQGIFSNVITLINVITAGILATSLYEPLARWLDSQQPTLTYFWDFIALWSLFALFLIIFRLGSDLLSRTQIRFKKVVDLAGGSFFALWISWVLVCFTAASLHMAPLSASFLFGSFQPEPESRLFLGLAPDQQWLGFVQKLSAGSFSTSPPAGVPGELGSNVFDPEGEFVFNYQERRDRLERAPGLRVHRD